MCFLGEEGGSFPFPHANTHVLLQRDEGRHMNAHPKSTTTSSPMQQLGINPSLAGPSVRAGPIPLCRM